MLRPLTLTLGLLSCAPADEIHWLDEAAGERPAPAAEVFGFDSLPLGPIDAELRWNGVRLSFPGSPGVVVDSAASLTPDKAFTRVIDVSLHRLSATSGTRLLSPGGALLGPGPNPAVELDHLTLEFDPPVRGAWIDVLFQSLDGGSDLLLTATLADGSTHDLALPISVREVDGFSAAGAVTAGLRTDGSPLVRLEFIESDDDAKFADSNVGYDTLRVLR